MSVLNYDIPAHQFDFLHIFLLRLAYFVLHTFKRAAPQYPFKMLPSILIIGLQPNLKNSW